MPTVTYLSDIHLEFYKNPISYDIVMVPRATDILCLAGDIGYPELDSYKKFLEYCSATYNYVFIICGNHEFYQTSTHYMKTISTTQLKIKEICSAFHNVHFLCDSSYYIEEYDVHILGTTLWSDPSDINYFYNDYKKIHNMTLFGYMNKLHEMSVAFLETELEKHKKSTSKVLVLSHHLPSFDLIASKYRNSDMSDLFASNLNYLFRDYKIDHWICGHSHAPVQKTIENTHIWMNPIGYPGENQNVCWTPYFTL